MHTHVCLCSENRFVIKEQKHKQVFVTLVYWGQLVSFLYFFFIWTIKSAGTLEFTLPAGKSYVLDCIL